MELDEPSPLWSPPGEWVSQANITRYRHWLNDVYGLSLTTYPELWAWSVNEPDHFWQSLFRYFDIACDGALNPATNARAMPDTRWFEDVSLSYAEHIFRHHPRIALITRNEHGDREEVSSAMLRQQVASFQHYLRSAGVRMGDRIVAYLPNGIEATVSFLAANGMGCVWSSCSPDFGVAAVVERFAQIAPGVIVATTQYSYGGRIFDTTEALREIVKALPSLQQIVLTGDNVSNPCRVSDAVVHAQWHDVVANNNAALECRRVPFNHPIWILYSSGTTGTPKAIVHGTGGILLEHLKYGHFHNDFKPGDRCFWFTTTGWMMWNYIHSSLLAGGTVVLFDGNPGYPDLMTLWNLADQERIAHFGVSASFLLACQRQQLSPGATLELEALRSIGSTGSTLPEEGFHWVYQHVKRNVWLASMSGGSDVCSAFVGGNPTLPVYAGEIQCRALGCSLFAFDDHGTPVADTVGEMVITKPMPSMPLYFWGDDSGSRYRESYFGFYEGVWRHGDWIRITKRMGIIVYGRSDATLNRGGIRIGTSEIYRAVDLVKEVRDSLIVCIERRNGQFWMPLFVAMQPGVALTDDIRKQVNDALRSNFSPRHVPDEIVEVPDIPYTISGKKTEAPVKKILTGTDPAKALHRDVLRNPNALDFFIRLAANPH